MENFRIRDIIESSNGKLLNGDFEEKVKKIVIDSREADEDSMFVAILGEVQDGHIFLDSAFKNGCRFFLVSDKKRAEEFLLSISLEERKSINLILVENTELSLGKIAKAYRKNFNIPFIGVTGSVGKTTIRDMVYSVVSSKFKSLKNKKNLNNQFGVPLTIFNLSKDIECAVIEMGMSGFGEISYLADIVKPKIGIISNIGTSHIESLGSQEGIFRAKMEIAEGFDEGSTLIVNGDDKFLRYLLDEKDDKKYEIQSFGKKEKNTVKCTSIEIVDDNSTIFKVEIDGEKREFKIPTVGEHNVFNAMSAILVGRKLMMSFEEIQRGLDNFRPVENRQDVVKLDNFTIINDVYNASPDSMIASLKVLGICKGRKIAILGDCLEMGSFAEDGHRRIGLNALKNSDVIITTGKDAKFIGIEAKEKGYDLSNLYHFDTKKELMDSLDKILKKDDVVLVKASRGMKFEDIVSKIFNLNSEIKKEGGKRC